MYKQGMPRGTRPQSQGTRPQIRPQNQGIRPPFQGIQPPFQGIRPPFQGIPPPFQGIRPQNQGIRPPFQGIRAPFQGIPPPFQGIPPPFQGFRPSFQGFRPPFQGIRPQIRPQVQRIPTKVVPKRSKSMAKERVLLIDPMAKAYLLNPVKQQFHWMSAECLGSAITMAQHEGTNNYVDFSDDDAYDTNLYHYTDSAEKELVNFNINGLSAIMNNDYSLLKKELERFYPNEDIEVKVVNQKPFCLDFEDGTTINGARSIMDYLCVMRLDIKIEHKLWSLSFSVFDGHEPCPCGIPKHDDPIIDCSRPFCCIGIARTYEQLEKLAGQIPLPPQEFVVYLHKTLKIDGKTIFKASLEGTQLITAEEAKANPAFNVDAYTQYPSLNTQPNLLSYHGQRVFENHSFRLFSHYERTLYHVIAIEKMEHTSSFDHWVRDIVKGLEFLHDNGLYHGNVSPANIVVLGSQALLHGLTTGGSQEGDIRYLGALLFHLFTKGSFFGKDSYIPSPELCDEQLKSTDPEANDLVQGLISCRLSLRDVMTHPKFWNARLALDFISYVSDHVQDAKWPMKRVDYLLEDALKKIEGDVYAHIKKPGSKGMTREFLQHSFVHGVRGYGSDRKVPALIRGIRNWYRHILDRSKADERLKNSVLFMKRVRECYPDLVLLLCKNLPKEIWKEEELKILIFGEAM